MASQTKQIMEEILRNNEVLKSKVTEESGTNGSNLMHISIEEEEEEEVKYCFDDEVLDLR